MGKTAKRKVYAANRAKKALQKIIEMTRVYFNDTKMLKIHKLALDGLKIKP